MRRWLLNLTTAMALILFIAVAALWIRSYFVFDRFEYNSTPGPSESQLHFGAESNADAIALGYVYFHPISPLRVPPPFTPGTDRKIWPAELDRTNPIHAFARENGHEFAGFGMFFWDMSAQYPNAGRRVGNYGVIFPHWAAALLSGVVAGWGIWRIVRHRRRVDGGRCLACGYDLRATPERCPECGKVPDAAHLPQGG